MKPGWVCTCVTVATACSAAMALDDSGAQEVVLLEP